MLHSGRLCLGWRLIPTVDGFNADELRVQAKQNQHHTKHYEVVLDSPVANKHHQVKRPQEYIEERADLVHPLHCPLSLVRQEPSVDESRPVPSLWRRIAPKWRVQRAEDNDNWKSDYGDNPKNPDENTQLS